jgi:hypothetical protein
MSKTYIYLKIREISNGKTRRDEHARRLKSAELLYSDKFERIKKLANYNYTSKDDEGKAPMVGVLAQDIQLVIPVVTKWGDTGLSKIRIDDRFSTTIKVAKENNKRLSKLGNGNNELLRRIETLEKRSNL